jgi:hypothetical protein
MEGGEGLYGALCRMLVATSKDVVRYDIKDPGKNTIYRIFT